MTRSLQQVIACTDLASVYPSPLHWSAWPGVAGPCTVQPSKPGVYVTFMAARFPAVGRKSNSFPTPASKFMAPYLIKISIKSDSYEYWPSIHVLKKFDLFAIFKYLAGYLATVIV